MSDPEQGPSVDHQAILGALGRPDGSIIEPGPVTPEYSIKKTGGPVRWLVQHFLSTIIDASLTMNNPSGSAANIVEDPDNFTPSW